MQTYYQEQPFPVRILSGYTTSGGVHLYSWKEISLNSSTGYWAQSGTPMPRIGVGNLIETRNNDVSGDIPFNAIIRREGSAYASPTASGLLWSGTTTQSMYTFDHVPGGGITFTVSGTFLVSGQCTAGSGFVLQSVDLTLQFQNGILVSGYLN